MLHKHFTTYTLVTLLLAMLAGLFTFFYLNSVRALESKAIQVKLASFKSKETVILAKRDITAGTIINSDDVKGVKILSAYVSPRAVRKVSEAIGQTAQADIYKGEQIAAGRVAVSKGEMSASGIIGKDKVALALPVDEISGVGGGIRAGDYVDILVTYEESNNTQIIYKHILVRGLSGVYPFGAAGNKRQSGVGFNNGNDNAASSPSAVILEVNESQAEALTYASEKGKLRLALLPAQEE